MSQPAVPPEGKPAAPPVDFQALIEVITRLPAELEREWSRALNISELSNGYDKLNQQLSALFRAIQLEAIESGSAAESLGHSNILDKWPLSVAEASNLSPDVEGETRFKQLMCALTYAIAELGLAVKAAPVPTGQEIKLPVGVVEKWWESGAFNRIRRAAQLVSRIYREVSVLQTPPPSPIAGRPNWDTNYGLAQDALLAGLPEAAVSYFNHAIKDVVSALIERDVPSVAEAISQLRNVERLESVADLLQLSAKLAFDHASGVHVDLGVSVPIAHTLPLAFNLLIIPPLTAAERIKLAQINASEDKGGTDAKHS